MPEHEQEPTPPRSAWAAGHVIVAVVVALSLGALLNAEDLLATAERQEFGWQRDVTVALAERLVAVSDAVGLDVPRAAVEVALGRRDGGLGLGNEPVAADEPQPAPGASPAASPSPAPGPSPSPSPTRAPISAAAPLRLYIGGDSMVEIQFGTALEDLADDTGVIEVVRIDFDRGSGLSRPDFVDWPARLAAVSAELDPEVMVLYFGGNDAQPLKLDGVVHEPEAPEWQAEYRRRVAGLMDQLVEAGHRVYWMGLPITSSERTSSRFAILNTIYEQEAQGREAVAFVPMWDVFADASGAYAEYLPNRNGDVVDMRLNDGIHLTTAGAYRAARPTIARIIEDLGITPQPPDG